MRIGVVGLGVISRYYLAAMAAVPSLRLAAVCDVDERALRPHRGLVACYRDHEAMLAGTVLDAVVVTVPNDVHAAVCRDVLAAGLPVCVEKPLATTLADGRELTRLAAERGLHLFTAFHRRYNDNTLALAGRLRGRAPVESVVVRYLERIEDHVGHDGWYLDPARCGGGCVADNGPNAFDLARLLVGPLRLLDCELTRDDSGVDRSASITLRADAGATVLVELDWSYPGEAKDVEVRLTGGGTDRADLLAGHPAFKSSLRHEYVGVLRDFARMAPAADGLAALELVDAAYRGRTLVGPAVRRRWGR